MTKVSIVTPTYNREDTIGRAIESALEQTYEQFEMIIVDDGSIDNTSEIVKQYNDNRIRYVRYTPNKGQNHARNVGLRNAQGKYITYLDSDDEFLPRHLEVAVKKLEQLSDEFAGVVTGHRDDLGGEVVEKDVYNGRIVYDDLINDMYAKIGGLSLLTFRREILNTIGFHDESVTKCTDLDFYLQILEEYNLFGINETLCYRYKQEDSVSMSAKNITDGEQVIIDKYSDNLTAFNLSKRRYNKAIAHTELGEMANARRDFFKCILDYPYRKKYYYHFLLSIFGKQLFDQYSLVGREFNS